MVATTLRSSTCHAQAVRVPKTKTMQCKTQQRLATALVASVAILAASTVTITTAQTQDCELYYPDSGALSWNTTFAEQKYFSCAEYGGFLVGVEATKDDTLALDALSWT